jgi:cytochrome c biogenesis protein CcdA
MSVYSTADEERIRAAAQVRAWTQSGLLDAAQGASIESGLRTKLRRTNRALRIALFIFGTMVVLALVGLCIVAFDLKLDSTVAWTAIVAGVAYFMLAQSLIFKFHLYRFGVEEAFAVWAIVLAGFGAGFLVSASGTYGDPPALTAFVTAAAAGAAVYWRFGYLYAAFAAVACAAFATFNLGLSRDAERILSACVLLVVFVVARAQHRTHDEDFRGDDYAAIESAAWLGIYAVLNLQLSLLPFGWHFGARPDFSSAFYWFTYAASWLLPVIGLALAVRDKHRPMLWANLVMMLATLATNKPYLGWKQHTWDPMLLGLLLVAVAMGVRRWLSRGADGHRGGFTPQPLVVSADRQALDALGTLAVAAQPFAPRPPGETPTAEPGRGGRSGGAGGGADF